MHSNWKNHEKTPIRRTFSFDTLGMDRNKDRRATARPPTTEGERNGRLHVRMGNTLMKGSAVVLSVDGYRYERRGTMSSQQPRNFKSRRR